MHVADVKGSFSLTMSTNTDAQYKARTLIKLSHNYSKYKKEMK